MALPLIAIDGPAGSGKSTTGLAVANRLGVPYLDTGAMYRAAAWAVLNRGLKPDATDAVLRLVSSLRISYLEGEAGLRIWVDDKEVTDAIRSPEVTRAVTPVCEIPLVRKHLVELQRRWADRGFGIMEGRDIGTVVLTEAKLKIFLTARPEVRARRRARDMGIENDEGKIAALAAEIAERDRRDSQRADSPLRAAADMVTVDNSDLLFAAQVNLIISLAAERFGLMIYGAAGGDR